MNMAVLRPDQSQLTFVGESVPGADPDRIVPNVAYTASSVNYASFFSRTPTINVLLVVFKKILKCWF